MFDLRLAVKTALARRSMTMTALAESIGKDRASLTQSLYNGNPLLETIKSVAYGLDFELSEFFKLGES